MRNEKPRDDGKTNGMVARLDRAAEKMNAFLLVLAMGLAVLDFTCFWIIKVHDAGPTVTRIASSPAAAAQTASPAVKPPRSAVASGGS